MSRDASSRRNPKSRLRAVLDRLAEAYGTQPWNWHTQQHPFEVLIGTVLSQRTRDEQTDAAAKALLARYPTANHLALAPRETIEQLIRPSNYHKTKAARIQAICRALLEDFDGEVPASIEPLMTLPGVGRKTAACVMVYGFGVPAIPVDTHVHRIANRMGLICTDRAEQSEAALWQIADAEHAMLLNDLFVKHGQVVCKPRSPACASCPVYDLCDRVGVLGETQSSETQGGGSATRKARDRRLQASPSQGKSRREP